MMKRSLTTLAFVALVLIMTGCGRFAVDGQVIPETTPTPIGSTAAPDEPALVQNGIVVEDAAPRLPDNALEPSPFRFGLIEIVLVLSLMVLASVVVGAYFLIRNRTPTSGYPQVQGHQKRKKSVAQLLQFHPDVVSLVLALCAWAILLGIVAVLATGALFLGRDAFSEEWEPVLTYPSSILIGADFPHVRLAPGIRDCMLSAPSSETDQVLCNILFEGATLGLDVTLENDTGWYCSASYAGESVPCRASFDLKDNRTFVVIPSNLGLNAERFQQLAEATANSGWGERDWLGLARALVAVLSLIALILLWRHSGNRPDDRPAPNTLFRLIYTLGISLMISATAFYISIVALLAFSLVD